MRACCAVTSVHPWVEVGIPAPAIPKAMTTSATRLLGVDNVPGTRKIGQFACLIATPHNPRTDIQTVNRVSFVTMNGEVVER